LNKKREEYKAKEDKELKFQPQININTKKYVKNIIKKTKVGLESMNFTERNE